MARAGRRGSRLPDRSRLRKVGCYRKRAQCEHVSFQVGRRTFSFCWMSFVCQTSSPSPSTGMTLLSKSLPLRIEAAGVASFSDSLRRLLHPKADLPPINDKATLHLRDYSVTFQPLDSSQLDPEKLSFLYVKVCCSLCHCSLTYLLRTASSMGISFSCASHYRHRCVVPCDCRGNRGHRRLPSATQVAWLLRVLCLQALQPP
jgi:hypothetical protein